MTREKIVNSSRNLQLWQLFSNEQQSEKNKVMSLEIFCITAVPVQATDSS
jgi:hypothetical protein